MVKSIDSNTATGKKGTKDRDLTVTLKLLPPYADRARQAAKNAKISSTKMLQRLVVECLEYPERESLLQDIAILTREVVHLQHEVQKLQVEMEGLRIATYLTTELLLVLICELSPEEAHQIMQEVLAEEDESHV